MISNDLGTKKINRNKAGRQPNGDMFLDRCPVVSLLVRPRPVPSFLFMVLIRSFSFAVVFLSFVIFNAGFSVDPIDVILLLNDTLSVKGNVQS